MLEFFFKQEYIHNHNNINCEKARLLQADKKQSFESNQILTLTKMCSHLSRKKIVKTKEKIYMNIDICKIYIYCY